MLLNFEDCSRLECYCFRFHLSAIKICSRLIELSLAMQHVHYPCFCKLDGPYHIYENGLRTSLVCFCLDNYFAPAELVSQTSVLNMDATLNHTNNIRVRLYYFAPAELVSQTSVLNMDATLNHTNNIRVRL